MKFLFLQRDAVMTQPGVMSISAVLKQGGHQCDILVQSLERDFLTAIVKHKPDAIGISCTTGLHLWAIETARRIKKRIDVPIVAGGPHATFYADAMNDSNIDIICIGEGEYPMLELAESIATGHDISSIRNLWVRTKEGQIRKNDLRPFIQDLDALPFMDRELYHNCGPLRVYERYPIIMTGRGCPYSCSFCFNKSLRQLYSKAPGPYVRRRSVNNVIDEILTVKTTYHPRKLMIMDDTFILDHEWVLGFLEVYRQDVRLPFSCLVRADLVNEQIAGALERAGCFFVRMGLESGNEQLRNRVLNKGITTQQIKNAAHLIKRHGIKLQTCNVLGAPGESMDTALQTLRVNLEIRPDFAWCALLQPYPKTDLSNNAIANGSLRSDFTFDDLDHSYFFSTPIQFQDKTAVTNLQKFFSISVAFPFLLPLVKRLVRLPENPLFDLSFKLYYAFGSSMMREMDLEDYVRLGFRATAFLRRGEPFVRESLRSVSSGPPYRSAISAKTSPSPAKKA